VYLTYNKIDITDFYINYINGMILLFYRF